MVLNVIGRDGKVIDLAKIAQLKSQVVLHVVSYCTVDLLLSIGPLLQMSRDVQMSLTWGLAKPSF